MKHSSPDWLPIKPSAGIRLWGVGIFLLWSLMAVMTVYWHLQGEAQDVMFHLLIWLLGLGAVLGFVKAVESRERAVSPIDSRFRTLFEKASDPIVLVDEQFRTVDCNQACVTFLGAQSKQQLLGLSPLDLSPERQPGGVTYQQQAEIVSQELARSGKCRFEWTHRSFDGRALPVEVSITAIYMGGKTLWYAIWRDISDRLEAERALRENEERWKLALEGSNTGVWDWRISDGRVFLSAKLLSILGYGADELVDDFQVWFNNIHPDDRPWINELMFGYLRRGEGVLECEHRIRNKDGDYIWVRVRGIALERDAAGVPQRMVGTHDDITVQKRAEQALEQSEQRFRAMVETSLDSTVMLSEAGEILYSSSSIRNVLGFEPEDVAGHHILEFIAPGWHEPMRLGLREVIARPQSHVELEALARHKGGGWRRCSGVATNLLDNPAVRAVVLTYRDITDKRKAEEKIRSFEALTNASADAIIMISPEDLAIVYANKAAHQLFRCDYPSREMQDRPGSDFWPREDLPLLDEILPAARAAGWRGNVRQKRLDGDLFHANATVFFVPTAEGGRELIGVMIRDISEEVALQDELVLIRFAVDHSSDSIMLVNPDSSIAYVNDVSCLLTGYSRDELLSMFVPDLDPSVTLEQANGLFGLLRREGHLLFETVHRRKDGSTFPVEVDVNYFTHQDKEHGWSIQRDITERKYAERALKDSEQHFRELYETALVALWRIRVSDGVFLRANNTAARLLGYESVNDIVEKVSILDLVPVDAREVLTTQMIDFESKDLELKLRRTDGSPVVVALSFGFYFNRDYVEGAAVDITERKLAQQALVTSELRYKSLVANIPGAVYRCKADGARTPVFISQGMSQLCSRRDFGRIRAGQQGLSLLIHPDDRQRVNLEVLSAVRQAQPYDVGYRLISEGLPVRWVQDRGQGIMGADGSLDHLDGVIIDVSEAHDAGQEAEHLRLLLANIIDAMPSVIVGVDRSLQVVQWNRSAESWLGIARQLALRSTLYELTVEFRQLAEQLGQTMRLGSPYRVSKMRWLRRGEPLYVDVTINPLKEEGITGAVIRIDDVTERARIDEVMVQSEKMLSVGGLAAGMAHEINNPLAGILQNMQVMRGRLLEDLAPNLKAADSSGISLDALRAYLRARKLDGMMEAISDSAKRASHIVENMLSFSRKGEGHKQPEELARLLDLTLELAANDYDLKKKYDFRDIRIERDYQAHSPMVVCEAGKIQQVILNLLKNAAQALVQVEKPGFSPRLLLQVRSEGEEGVTVIEDNADGMPEEVRRRVFEPFFTTKEVGVGTGLGLSVSYFIVVNDHKGSMTVDSTPGVGTRFTVRLPLARTGTID